MSANAAQCQRSKLILIGNGVIETMQMVITVTATSSEHSTIDLLLQKPHKCPRLLFFNLDSGSDGSSAIGPEPQFPHEQHP
jgi:hypothetical protein